MSRLIATGIQAEHNLIMVVLVIFALCAMIMTPTCVFAQSGRTSEEKNGVCEMEAEAATVTQNGDTVNWVEMKDPQASGGAYMTTPNAGKKTQWNDACELSFRVKITTPGDYFIAVRQIGRNGSNSAQLGLNGIRIKKSCLESTDKTWKWLMAEEKRTLTLPAGEHVIQIRRREAGWKIDKIMIAKDIRDIPDMPECMIPVYPPHKKLESGWVIHQIDNPKRALSNGLDWADVNKDGLPDYLTSYELSGLVRLSFHPGVDKIKTLDSWRSVDIGQLEKAKCIVLGDLDDDSNVDAAICSGEFSNVNL